MSLEQVVVPQGIIQVSTPAAIQVSTPSTSNVASGSNNINGNGPKT